MSDWKEKVEFAVQYFRSNFVENPSLNSIQQEREMLRLCGQTLASESDSLRAERDKWKDEYENLCKFTTDYERQRDGLRIKLIIASEAISRAHNLFSVIVDMTLDEKILEIAAKGEGVSMDALAALDEGKV